MWALSPVSTGLLMAGNRPVELSHLRRYSLVEVNWSISANEEHTKNFEALAKEILKKAKPGGIIDLHDGYGNDHGTPQANKSLEVKAPPLIIKGLQDRGYSFVTVPELIGQPSYNQVVP